MKVVAVIGDIIASKQVVRRDALQRRLGTVLAATGRSEAGLASPYTITLGDEFQAVYRRADTILADLVGILTELHPVRVRFALGIGPLTTRLNSKQALGMDGPAFHHARVAMNALKGKRALFRIESVRGETSWELANHTLAHVAHYLRHWEKNRLQILNALLRGRSVRELESELGISKVAIYKNIRAAALDEVVAIWQELTRALDGALRSS